MQANEGKVNGKMWEHAEQQPAPNLHSPSAGDNFRMSSHKSELDTPRAASIASMTLQPVFNDRLSELPGLEGTVYAELPVDLNAALSSSLGTSANGVDKLSDSAFGGDADKLQKKQWPALLKVSQQSGGKTTGQDLNEMRSSENPSSILLAWSM